MKKIIFSVLIVMLLLLTISAASAERVGQAPLDKTLATEATEGEALMMSMSSTSTGLSTVDLTTSLTPEQLVQNLLGSGVTVTDVRYTGVPVAAGTFSGGSGIIGFEEGIILSSGAVSNVVGPNSQDGTTTSNGLSGDADLNGLIPGYTTYDATVLEFDFIPDADLITFNYVFGSEEYNEYVGSSFNDVFGFFLNGVNVASIPGTSTAVSINNVNLGSNPSYYKNNDLGDGGGSINTELDGLTVVLTITAPVNKGEGNTIKLAIADAGDTVLDSDVFIEAETFTSSDFILSPQTATNLVGETHTVVAELKEVTGGVVTPVVGENVNFEVIEGPNTGLTGSAVTDSEGKATWSYSSMDVGTDKIKAYVGEAVNPSLESNVVTKTWITNTSDIPEFPTIALPAMVVLGLAFVFQRRRD